MGNEQSSMRLTEEERAYYLQKGYDDFAEKCRPIDAANAAKRERRQHETEAQATQHPSELHAARAKAASTDELKDASDIAASSENSTTKAKADREAAEHQTAGGRKRGGGAKKQAAAKNASEIKALRQQSAAAQASISQSKEVKQAGLENKSRKAGLPTRPSPEAHTQPAPRRQQHLDKSNASSSKDYLIQWGARKEPRRVDSPLEPSTNESKSTDDDTLFVPARPDSSRQTATNNVKQTPTLDTNPRASQNRSSSAHTRQPESTSGAAATSTSASAVLPSSAKPSLANTRRPSQSDGAAQAPVPVAGVKRPQPITSLTGLGPIPKKSRTTESTSASPQSPQNSAAEGDSPPEWYSKLKKGSLAKGEGDADNKLKNVRTYIEKAKDSYHGRNHERPTQFYFNAVREVLHSLTFTQVNERLLRNNRMLHNEDSLPQIFDERYDGGLKWPADIKADAQELYQRWKRRDFDTDIMRGINFAMAGQQGGDSIEPGAKRDAKREGHNGLVNGQWWPTLVCAVRDGAHGATVAGIAGEKDRGAYSCFISGGGDNAYPDIDEGETVKYCGTDSTNGEVSFGTQLMIASMQNGIPVRFIRSSKAKSKSEYAPELGFRYDGLYDVKDYEILDPQIHRHRFTLVRRPGQAPIRGGDGVEARPTQQERDAYKTHKQLAGGK